MYKAKRVPVASQSCRDAPRAICQDALEGSLVPCYVKEIGKVQPSSYHSDPMECTQTLGVRPLLTWHQVGRLSGCRWRHSHLPERKHRREVIRPVLHRW